MLKESVLQGTRENESCTEKQKSKQTILRKRENKSMRLGDGIGKSMIVNVMWSD